MLVVTNVTIFKNGLVFESIEDEQKNKNSFLCIAGDKEYTHYIFIDVKIILLFERLPIFFQQLWLYLPAKLN